MALSSTLRENEKVVSSIFTVPMTMRFFGRVSPFVSRWSTTFPKKEFLSAAVKFGNNVFTIIFATSSSKELNGLMMGSVMYSLSSKLRLSIALRNSAKYSSTGARFISSRHKKNGTSGCCHALTINSMNGVNT